MTPGAARVLLADDEEAIRANLAAFLVRCGFDVVSVADGEAALAEALSTDPDLLVLDVVMPGIDGREVLRRLRGEGRWNPVVLLTKVARPASGRWPWRRGPTTT